MTEPRIRRRVSEEGPDTEGRRGCLFVGSFLGVLAGGLFAFFAIPWLADHYFGAEEVAHGETYEDDDLEIQILRADNEDGRVTIMLVESGAGERPPAVRFRLEMSDRRDRIEGATEDCAPTEGATRCLVFGVEAGDGDPEWLHLSSPNVLFDLTPGPGQ